MEWLHLLVGDWQLIADLSFADLILWVRSQDDAWSAVAHVRPTTGQLVFVEDQVGQVAHGRTHDLLDEAAQEQRIIRVRQVGAGPEGAGREEYIPVVRDGQVVSVMTWHTDLGRPGPRVGSRSPISPRLTPCAEW